VQAVASIRDAPDSRRSVMRAGRMEVRIMMETFYVREARYVGGTLMIGNNIGLPKGF
jgi:hypothetical protein